MWSISLGLELDGAYHRPDKQGYSLTVRKGICLGNFYQAIQTPPKDQPSSLTRIDIGYDTGLFSLSDRCRKILMRICSFEIPMSSYAMTTDGRKMVFLILGDGFTLEIHE